MSDPPRWSTLNRFEALEPTFQTMSDGELLAALRVNSHQLARLICHAPGDDALRPQWYTGVLRTYQAFPQWAEEDLSPGEWEALQAVPKLRGDPDPTSPLERRLEGP